MKAYFEAYGCAMNAGESRELEARMLSIGWDRASSAEATEHVKDGTPVLRTDEYREVVVSETLGLGAYYEVRVDDTTPTYLLGTRRR